MNFLLILTAPSIIMRDFFKPSWLRKQFTAFLHLIGIAGLFVLTKPSALAQISIFKPDLIGFHFKGDLGLATNDVLLQRSGNLVDWHFVDPTTVIVRAAETGGFEIGVTPGIDASRFGLDGIDSGQFFRCKVADPSAPYWAATVERGNPSGSIAQFKNKFGFEVQVHGMKSNNIPTAVQSITFVEENRHTNSLFFNKQGLPLAFHHYSGSAIGFFWETNYSAYRLTVGTNVFGPFTNSLPRTPMVLFPRNEASRSSVQAGFLQPRTAQITARFTLCGSAATTSGKAAKVTVVQRLRDIPAYEMPLTETSPGVYSGNIPIDPVPSDPPALGDFCEWLGSVLEFCPLVEALEQAACSYPQTRLACTSLGYLRLACLGPDAPGSPGIAEGFCDIFNDLLTEDPYYTEDGAEIHVTFVDHNKVYRSASQVFSGQAAVNFTADFGPCFEARIYNVDDVSDLWIGGSLYWRTSYEPGDSGWFPLTDYLYYRTSGFSAMTSGILLEFETRNTLPYSGWTYGFAVRKDGNILYDQSCGQRGIFGCNNDEHPPAGVVFRGRYFLQY